MNKRYPHQLCKNSNQFNHKEEKLIESSKPQYFKYLDRLQEDGTLDCFKKDLFKY